MTGIRCPKCGQLHPVRKLSGQYRTASIVRVRVVEEQHAKSTISDPEIIESVLSIPVQAIAPPKKPAVPASEREYIARFVFRALPAAGRKVLPFFGISLLWMGIGIFLFIYPIPGSGSYAARLLAVLGTPDTIWGQPLLAAFMSVVLVVLTGVGVLYLFTHGIPILSESLHLRPDPQVNARYQKSHNRWEKLFYCRKCNHLFFPGSQNVMQMQPSLAEELRANEAEIENFFPRRSKMHFPTCPACHMRDAVEKSLLMSHTAVEAVGERAYSFAAEELGKFAPRVSRAFWVFSIIILQASLIQAAFWVYSVWAYHTLYGGTDFIQYTLQRIQTNPVTFGAYLSLVAFSFLGVFYLVGIIKRLIWLASFYCGRCDLTFIPGVWSTPFR
jgi:hypothetical protein